MKELSPFAKALYDLMITPGIYTIEEWCGYVEPWVKLLDGDGETIDHLRAQGAPETMKLINSWFADEVLPSGEQLNTILGICREGHTSAFMGWLHGDVSHEEIDRFVAKYTSGREVQEKALAQMDIILDKLVWEVTPLAKSVELFQDNILSLGMHIFRDQMSTIHALFERIPTVHRQSVMCRVAQVLREAQQNSWYEVERRHDEDQKE